MVNQQLIDYIKEQIQRGVMPNNIKTSLRASGWAEADIDQAFNSFVVPAAVIPTSKSKFKVAYTLSIALVLLAIGLTSVIILRNSSIPAAPKPKEVVDDSVAITKPEEIINNSAVVAESKTQPALSEIVQKFNNCSYVKMLPEAVGPNFKMFATANGDASISIRYDYIEENVQKQTTNQFNLNENILSIELNKNVTTMDEIGKLLVASTELQWLIDSVGQVYGYADGVGAKSANENSETTLEKNGWVTLDNGNSVITKIDISKKPVF